MLGSVKKQRISSEVERITALGTYVRYESIPAEW
jgi:hypothetical protein